MNGENNKYLDFWQNHAKTSTHQWDVKLFPFNDRSELDVKFLRPFLGADKTLLDVGSGSGLIVNKIHDLVKKIVAIEPFAEFSKHILPLPNITVINKTLQDFNTDEKFDILTIFEVQNYLTTEEAEKMYRKYINFLRPGGIIVINAQYGLNDDVIISGFSQELNKEYFSFYRHIDREIDLLARAGFTNINVSEIYPPEENRWPNTHHFGITANKPSE